MSDKVEIRNLRYATGSVNTAGANTIIAAPGPGYSIVVSFLEIQNESGTATTVTINDNGIPKFRYFGQNQGDGVIHQFPIGREWMLSKNGALVLNLSGANQIGYSVQYRIESA